MRKSLAVQGFSAFETLMIFSVVSVNFNRFNRFRCRFYYTHSIRTSDVQFDFCLRFEIGTQTQKENHPIGWFFFLLLLIESTQRHPE